MTKAQYVAHIMTKHPELVHPSTKSALMGYRLDELQDCHVRMHVTRGQDENATTHGHDYISEAWRKTAPAPSGLVPSGWTQDSMKCPVCKRYMSTRERDEQGICNDCQNETRQ